MCLKLSLYFNFHIIEQFQVDLLKDKTQLFKTTRLLTNGVVAGVRESHKASQLKRQQEKSLPSWEDLFDRMDGKLKTQSAKDSSQKEVSNIQDDTCAESHDCQQNPLFKKVPDLWNNQEWHEYHSQLKAISLKIRDEKGWSGFDAVFMISAIDGDGVSNLKVGVCKGIRKIASVLNDIGTRIYQVHKILVGFSNGKLRGRVSPYVALE